jgi:hypothetical protein
MMQDILKLIQARESARGPFDSQRPVPKQDLEQILEAGRWAPTAHNMQNFEFVVVDDATLRFKFKYPSGSGGVFLFLREKLPFTNQAPNYRLNRF